MALVDRRRPAGLGGTRSPFDNAPARREQNYTTCKRCRHLIVPGAPRVWSRNPLGLIHPPGDCP